MYFGKKKKTPIPSFIKHHSPSKYNPSIGNPPNVFPAGVYNHPRGRHYLELKYKRGKKAQEQNSQTGQKRQPGGTGSALPGLKGGANGRSEICFCDRQCSSLGANPELAPSVYLHIHPSRQKLRTLARLGAIITSADHVLVQKQRLWSRAGSSAG